MGGFRSCLAEPTVRLGLGSAGTELRDGPPPRSDVPRRRLHRPAAVLVILVSVILVTAIVATTSVLTRATSRPRGIVDTGAVTPHAPALPTGQPSPAASATIAAGPMTSSIPASTQRSLWTPEAGLSWQWQLSVPVDQTVNAAVYDIDMFENSASVVASLHAAGRKVICYVDVGSSEDFRPDAAKFPSSVLGKSDGWPGERWLDIRQIDVLRPIMAARFDTCAERGFDGVEPDLMDGFASDTGFPLTATDQLRYDLMIADLGHERGLAVGLKNDLTQIPQLVTHFEFAVNEQCAQYAECELVVPFIAAGKPVFHAEYDLPTSAFCELSTRLGFSSIRKKSDLGAWRETC